MILCASTMLTAMPLTAGAAEVEMMDATAQESAESVESTENADSMQENVSNHAEETETEANVMAEGETAEGLTVPALSDWEYSKDELAKTVILEKYVGNAERIKVPATYDSYKVMLKNAFANNTTVKEVAFEKGVTYGGVRLSTTML